jgi:hypothetical protein
MDSKNSRGSAGMNHAMSGPLLSAFLGSGARCTVKAPFSSARGVGVLPLPSGENPLSESPLSPGEYRPCRKNSITESSLRSGLLPRTDRARHLPVRSFCWSHCRVFAPEELRAGCAPSRRRYAHRRFSALLGERSAALVVLSMGSSGYVASRWLSPRWMP